MGIKDTIRHAVFTDEEEDHNDKPVTPIIGQAAAPAPAVASPAVVVNPNGVYQAILAGSRFEDTSSGQLIHKYLDPLSELPDSAMSPVIKFKTALVQVRAQNH